MTLPFYIALVICIELSKQVENVVKKVLELGLQNERILF